MNWKQFLKLTKGKVIVSLFVSLLVFLFVHFLHFSTCKMCAYLGQEGHFPEIISSCDCFLGSTFLVFVKEFFLVFAIPFAVTYLVYSLIFHLKEKISKNS